MLTVHLDKAESQLVDGDVLTFHDGDVIVWAGGVQVARFATTEVTALELTGVTGKPTYTVAAKREEHPAAYARWTAEDDARLLERSAAGAPVEELSQEFGRGTGAILSRLEKLSPHP